ncbi:hypothetical protein EST38_g7483 [Candolleomyces aberdarensis]|uniref:DEAD/DEAH-box helicase domain-containing protein n=1 Tax=Candolleomyces aberdarensis TaxID=2316362 RepID=A0A4Q2DGZ9_9AGAR|nr:hypothetical protein EST38_g7483 [Candolleomyces aberdarensis]
MLWCCGITKEESLALIREAEGNELTHWASCIPAELCPLEYLSSLSAAENNFCLRVILLVWIASNFTQIPKAAQLTASLAFLYKKDSLLQAGTGFGKTLLIVIALLLENPEDNSIVITISPLKRLQQTQSKAFEQRYGIQTMVINKDTMAAMTHSDWNASSTAWLL